MIFNSLEFLIFLPLVFSIYWSLDKKVGYQNIIILVSSYIFYGWWDWRFLSLIAFSTITDFIVGHKIEKAKGKKEIT
jgi:alginate O-acetyltransferase complex protein AlgI